MIEMLKSSSISFFDEIRKIIAFLNVEGFLFVKYDFDIIKIEKSGNTNENVSNYERFYKFKYISLTRLLCSKV